MSALAAYLRSNAFAFSEKLFLFQYPVKLGHYQPKATKLRSGEAALYRLIESDHGIPAYVTHLFALGGKVHAYNALVLFARNALDQSFFLHGLQRADQAPAFHAHLGSKLGAGCSFGVYAQEDLPDGHGATVFAGFGIVEPRNTAPDLANGKVDRVFGLHCLRMDFGAPKVIVKVMRAY